MENQNKKLYIKVPTSVVRNENYFLSNQEFFMYARLCFLYFRNYKKKEIEIDHKRFMRFLKISDTRTFKNRLKKLYEVGLIENEINKLPTKGSLKIILNDDIYNKDKHFTMLSSELFSYFIKEQIDEYAFRQIFYYKSHINMNDEERDRSFCFVSYDTLVKRLKISKSKVIKANRQLEKANLIKIEAHELETNYEYDEYDELIFNKFNNHYYVANALF